MNSYFICATQPSNLGDLIINKMLIDELCRYGNVYVDAYGIPAEFKSIILRNNNAIDVDGYLNITVKRFGIKNVLRLIKLVNNNKIKLLTQTPGPMHKLHGRTRLGFRVIYCLFRVLGVSIKHYGNCCSNSIASETSLAGMFTGDYYLRSYESINYAQKYAGNCRCEYIPDLAFLLHFHVNSSLKRKKDVIAFNVRFSPNSDKELLKNKSISIINAFTNKGFYVDIYFQVHSDITIAKEIYNDVLHNPKVMFRESIVWYDDMDFYADKRYVVSNRLHSLLVGCVYGATPIALMDNNPQQSKIKDVFYSSFNTTKNIIDLSNYESLNLEHFDTDISKLVEENARLCRDTINKSIKDLLE